MEENQIENLENNDVSTTEDYIKTIKDLKSNTVSKEVYLKQVEDNKKLLNALANGETVETTKVKHRPTQEIRDDLFNNENNNLEFWEKTLELRAAVLEDEGKDIFLPVGHEYQASENDINTANKVADVVQQCIDYADGDSMVFTNELQRRTNDTALPRRR
jgi:hypothetical protein